MRVRASVLAGLILFGSSVQAIAQHAPDQYAPEGAEFVFASDLAARGFVPFGLRTDGESSFGMAREAELYACFSADKRSYADARTNRIVAALNGQSKDRTVPNLPYVCIEIE